MASIVILVLHFYYTCHFAFEAWGYTSVIMDNILLRLSKTGLFQNAYVSKLFILGLLVISLFGSKGKKHDEMRLANCIAIVAIGFSLFMLSHFLFILPLELGALVILYLLTTTTGWVLVLTGGTPYFPIVTHQANGRYFQFQK